MTILWKIERKWLSLVFRFTSLKEILRFCSLIVTDLRQDYTLLQKYWKFKRKFVSPFANSGQKWLKGPGHSYFPTIWKLFKTSPFPFLSTAEVAASPAKHHRTRKAKHYIRGEQQINTEGNTEMVKHRSRSIQADQYTNMSL